MYPPLLRWGADGYEFASGGPWPAQAALEAATDLPEEPRGLYCVTYEC